MIKFDSPTFESTTDKEWLVTNGLGGYASSTISGANTRRYHGLFVPSLRPPTERTVYVSKIEETIIRSGNEKINLSSNQYPGTIHPDGYRWITSFERKPFPLITFGGEDFKLTKCIFMPHEANTSVVHYINAGKTSFELELNPLFVFRDYHHLFHEEKRFDFYRQDKGQDVALIYPNYGARPFYVQCPGSNFQPRSAWYKNFIYQKETERGLDDREDAFSIGTFTVTLHAGESCQMVFILEPDQLNQNWEKAYEKEVRRLKALNENKEVNFSIPVSDEVIQFYNDLIVAGDQFIVNRSTNDGKTIIAGYHWFTDWGRDTMIAMRGLVIAEGHQALAKNIVRTFLHYLKDGLIPNRFPDQGETPEYNTIDASLWMFIVLYEYHQKFQDLDFIEECLPFLHRILSAYKHGTNFNIHMTEEGLIYGGEDLSQLTWMDAKVGDYVVTPRHGCPVEINALWYNALCIFTDFQKACKQDGGDWVSLEDKVYAAFRQHFITGKGYLFDVIIPGGMTDDSFRPNQIYAMSLPYPLLTREESEHLISLVHEKLWTPLGIRSLSMDHPDFIGIYTGDQWHRDKAYHQGTVWAYLMGEYLIARLKTNEFSAASKQEVIEMMSGLQSHFYHSDCINGISEVFDGENPGPGKGCIHQAWSVGMLLLVFDQLKNKS